MKALITGGAGCIGSELAAELLARGSQVTIVDNLSSGKIEHIEALLRDCRFEFIEADLLQTGIMDAALGDTDIVFHLAANPDVKFTPGDATDKDLQQNILVTYNVLEAMRRHGVRKLAFASTSAVYGIAEHLPIPENAPFPKPISLYGATKMSCEALISSFQHLFGFQCWIFRFANIVGSKVRKKGRTVIADFIHRLSEHPQCLQILGNGKQAKSYLLSAECVDAMLYVVGHAHDPVNVYNLGCDDWISVDRIADLVAAAMGLRNVEYAHTGTEGGWPGDVPRFRLDVTALNRLGWKARHNSEEAVSIAIHAILETVGGRFGK
jgi:UDP-glucose 4-epimerase